ncbi:MAG: hypothetical protein JJV97_01525 [SAR324 cluster bacterium]|nr:hypothetical protein [SAR324 cluster bacterium]
MFYPKNFVWNLTKPTLYEGVDYLCRNIKEPFCLSWAIDIIKKKCLIFNPSPNDNIKTLLNESHHLGIVYQPDLVYYPACILFENTNFVIYPSKHEIINGLLILGDSLQPYYSTSLHFKELTFIGDNGTTISSDLMSFSYEELDRWYLDISNLKEVLVNDLLSPLFNDLDNYSANDEVCYRAPILMLKDFYIKHNFKPGDGVIFSVNDYHKGILSLAIFRSVPKTNLKFRSLEFQMEIERNVSTEIDNTGLHPSPMKALVDCYARMRHLNRWENLFPVAWLRCLKRSKKLNVFSFNHETIIYKGELDIAKRASILQELNWPCLKMENLIDFLETVGCYMSIDVLKAYTFIAIHQGEDDYHKFFADIIERFATRPLDKVLHSLFYTFAGEFWQKQLIINSEKTSALSAPSLLCLKKTLTLYENTDHLYRVIDPLSDEISEHKFKILQSIRLSCELALSQLKENQLNKNEIMVLEKMLKEMSESLNALK